MTKYKNKPQDGYASGKEARRGVTLEVLQRDGRISNLREQVRYEVIPKQQGERATAYIADFVYTDERGDTVVEDVKSDVTRKLPAYIMKRKLMLLVHGIKIVEV
jgi:hypothetical protein